MTPDELLVTSKRRIQVADHFLTQTYPLVGDPKLLLNILDGILKALEEMVDAALIYERTAGRIPAYNDQNFAAKLGMFKGDLAKRYNLGHIDIAMVSEIQEVLASHRTSALEFARKGAYVMADDDYRLQTLTVEKIKTYLTRTKTLYTKIHDTILSK